MTDNPGAHRALGNAGEDFAALLLESKGHEILCRNYSAKGGEIDIISKLGEYIVFTEVKLRRGNYSPMAAVTHAKIGRVISCAERYLSEKGFDMVNSPPKVRIDIIALKYDGEEFALVNHIEGLNLVRARARKR